MTIAVSCVSLSLLAAGCSADDEQTSPVAAPEGCSAEPQTPADDDSLQRLRGDLDGNGTPDELVAWVRDGKRVVQVRLDDGEASEPEELFEGKLLEIGDVDGDGRAEVFAEADNRTVGLYVLDGCRLQRLDSEGDPFGVPVLGGPLICRGDGVLEQLRPTRGSETAQGTLVTHTYRLRDGEVVDEGEQVTNDPKPTVDLAEFQVLCE